MREKGKLILCNKTQRCGHGRLVLESFLYTLTSLAHRWFLDWGLFSCHHDLFLSAVAGSQFINLMRNPPTIFIIRVGTWRALIHFGTRHKWAVLGMCASCQCLSVSFQGKKAVGRHNVMFLIMGKWKGFNRESVQDHCCIPLDSKGLSSLLEVLSHWHFLDLIWQNRL